ncbi:MAG TPA: hypothetical protein VIV40_04730 [Kofleriaceae bacterium]
MRRLAVVAIACAACGAHTTPSNAKAPDAGVSIALYDKAGGDGYGVVDDRRWIEITGKLMLLPNIDPGAELASLVIEPTNPALHVGQCVRERMPDLPHKDPLDEYAEQQRQRRIELRRVPLPRRYRDQRPPEPAPPPKPAPDDDRFVPVVKCDVTAQPGRYLVHIVYVTKALGYRAQHDIDVRDDKQARVTSRFAITTPVWQTRAELVLFEGVPGGEHSPREVVRGQVTLDGSTSVLSVPTREVSSRLLRVYEGAVVTTADTTDVMWGSNSVQAIWVWLELAKLRLAPGPVHVHLDLPGEGIRDLDIPQQSRKQDDDPDAPLRLPLWVDESLRGSRARILEYNDGASITERFMFSIANTGDTARDVVIEEPMRTATRRKLERAWPKKPTADHNVLRSQLGVKPGRIERTGYTMTYDF